MAGICPLLTRPADPGGWRQRRAITAAAAVRSSGAPVHRPSSIATASSDHHVVCSLFRAARDAAGYDVAAGADPALSTSPIAIAGRRPDPRGPPEPAAARRSGHRLRWSGRPAVALSAVIVAFGSCATRACRPGRGGVLAGALETGRHREPVARRTPSPTPTVDRPSSPPRSRRPRRPWTYKVKKGDHARRDRQDVGTGPRQDQDPERGDVLDLKVARVRKIP
jgi:hypothetical protein